MKAIAIYTSNRFEGSENKKYYTAYDNVNLTEMMVDAQWAFDSGYYLEETKQYKKNADFYNDLRKFEESDNYETMN